MKDILQTLGMILLVIALCLLALAQCAASVGFRWTFPI